MRSSPLRDLGRRYATGNLRRKDYVTQRTQLLHRYVNGQLDIIYRESRPVVLVRKQGFPLWVPAIALVAGIAISLFVWHGATNTPAAGSAVAPAKDTPAGFEAAQDMNLIEGFLSGQDWSDGKLESMETDWKKLPAFKQEALRRTPEFRRLESLTRRKIEEVQALRALNDSAQSRLRETRLREFAAVLGLDITP